MTFDSVQLGPDNSVSDWVVDRPSRSRVFDRLGIDYCCHGEELLTGACRSHHQNLQTVLTELRAPGRAPAEHDWSHVPLTTLVDHIQQTHHAWLERELPRVAMLVHRTNVIHGLRRRWLADLKDLFDRFDVIIGRAMQKEEKILFPRIRRLPRNERGGSLLPLISALTIEHEELQTALERMKVLTGSFTPPAESCNTFRACLDALRELKDDTDMHLHEEDDILFTRALKVRFLGEDIEV